MAFIIKIENPEVVSIIKSLKPMCSVLPFEFGNDGLGLSMSDDTDAMAFTFMFRPSMFKEYEFSGDNIDKVALSAEKFSKIIDRMAYPFQIESTMDGSIRLVSAVGRQTYKQNSVDAQDKYFMKSERIKQALDNLVGHADAIRIEVLHQDLKEALKKVSIDTKNVIITLDNDKLTFTTDSIEVDAETDAPLLKPAAGEWKMTYNVEFFTSLLKIVNSNSPMELYLYPDRRSFVAYVKLEDGDVGASYCILSLAPVLQRREAVEEESVEEVVEDEPEYDEVE